MKQLSLLIILFTSLLSAQENYTISGTIKDVNNGETVFGASAYFKDTTTGVSSNEYGFFSLTAPKGTYTLIVSYMGYTDYSKTIVLDQNQSFDIELTENSTQLDEVVITSEESEQVSIKKPQMSVTKLNATTIKQMPVVLGEVDLIKSIQMLPGVTNNGEASSGFNVRGGAADQNLVLLDEAIIYNTSHLLGFFSVFNADAIKDVKLYKGGIPARFGGRVSSVLDVRQKDGNNKEFALTGGVGIISSRLAAEGPLYNDKGSFLVAGRSSYAHLFLKMAGEKNSLSFYDLNLKTNYNINDSNKIFLSGYFGRDNFDFSGNFKSNYGNLSGNLRWNKIFNEKLFSNLSLIYSKYDYQVIFDAEQLDWVSDIKNYNVKYDFKYFTSPKISFDFGASTIYYEFNPGEVKPTGDDSSINYLKLDQKRALESGLYLNAEHKITDVLTAEYGIRLSTFSRLGGQTLNEYENNQPVVYNDVLGVYESGTAIGETVYKKDDEIESYSNLEPRLALSYQINENSSVKASYNKVSQYIHLLSNTASVSPLDVWAPSGKFIKPQIADQFAMGYFRNLRDNSLALEAEVYYKTVDNRIDYIDGSDLIGKNNIETQILNGESRAYGLELLLRKSKGDFTGWLAYTLSKSEQRALGGNAGGPGINNGNWYNTAYDRTHDISFTGAYKWNDKWTFGTNLVFQTGRPATFPNGQYQYEGQSIASYSERNANRLTNYHRLDISAIYTPNRKPDNKLRGEWMFGIYNVYNRKNAASISFGQNKDSGENEATRTAIFGIVPSVTYNFKF
ncbi:TonB-dependent receptor-like protein [Gelidibacter algens]|uniref:TonB-dependent receptor-like protein n=1 Tax=Gelidibacter algens TaxID=49280 RepID=A0A1A7R2Y1_9FLAO|nr:TonB-dependent receptor [Gelidibacter algens]OBX25839.1 collagen-binding protein [Gelidibacter algens]RAJ20591.1 TonB-dependent receptor-like protein [Gelidibacter algens]